MNNATNLIVHTLLRRFDSNCISALSRARVLTSIPEVVQCARVTADPVIRSLTRSQPSFRNLRSGIEARLNTLIDQQIKKAADEPHLERRKALIGQFRARDWQALRGDFAMQWRRADNEATKLLHR
jgi:hypothetical protein